MCVSVCVCFIPTKLKNIKSQFRFYNTYVLFELLVGGEWGLFFSVVGVVVTNAIGCFLIIFFKKTQHTLSVIATTTVISGVPDSSAASRN